MILSNLFYFTLVKPVLEYSLVCHILRKMQTNLKGAQQPMGKVTYGKKDGGIVSSRKEKEKWATGLESSTILKFKEAGDQWFSVSMEVRMRINQLNL